MTQSIALSQREEEPLLISMCDAGVFSVSILQVTRVWLPGWPYQTWSWEEVCTASSCEQVQDVSTLWAFIYVLNLHAWLCIMIFLKSAYINHIKQWVLLRQFHICVQCSHISPFLLILAISLFIECSFTVTSLRWPGLASHSSETDPRDGAGDD